MPHGAELCNHCVEVAHAKIHHPSVLGIAKVFCRLGERSKCSWPSFLPPGQLIAARRNERNAEVVAVPETCFGNAESPKTLGKEMHFAVAPVAKGDEIFFDIVSEKASRLNVVHLKILGTSASLASPAIARKHLPTKLLIRRLIQSEPRMFR